MRASIALFPLPLLALAACGGASGQGPATLGNAGPIAGVSSGGSGTSSGSGSTTPAPANLFDVSAEAKFDAVGGLQRLNDDRAKNSTLYQGDASTVGAPSGSVTYNPRDGIFTLALADDKAGITRNNRYQDPAHRTDSSGRIILDEAPVLANFNYLDVYEPVSDTDVAGHSLFFYQRPGVTTNFVTLAGYTHVSYDPGSSIYTSEHGAFVFGSRTPFLQVPSRGTGSYAGDFLASMVAAAGTPSVFQWISGTSKVDVDFAKGGVSLSLAGTVLPATQVDTTGRAIPVNQQTLAIPDGATFSASASATMSGGAGSFSGSFTGASFAFSGGTAAIDFGKVNSTSGVAGASSVDGAFYGANAVELGGNFRVVGGIPGQRVDITGAFTGRSR